MFLELISRFFPQIFFALSVLISLITVYEHGISSEKGNLAVVAIKEVKKHDKIESNTMHLSDTELDKRLSRWMRHE